MPVAGIFKRLKDFAIKGMKGANVLNKVYKTLAPVVDMALDFIPYGSFVNLFYMEFQQELMLQTISSQMFKKEKQRKLFKMLILLLMLETQCTMQ